MRIIAGEYRGRILRTVNDRSVRPATDRVKESLFNILNNRIRLQGARILDLFAGSGSIGLEAVSRGAARAVFVEKSYPVLKIIEANIRMLGSSAVDRCEIVKGDAFHFVKESVETFDVVFIDPPYGLENSATLPALIMERKRVAPGGLMVMEHTKKLPIPESTLYRIDDQRTFGMTILSFIQPARMD